MIVIKIITTSTYVKLQLFRTNKMDICPMGGILWGITYFFFRRFTVVKISYTTATLGNFLGHWKITQSS